MTLAQAFKKVADRNAANPEEFSQATMVELVRPLLAEPIGGPVLDSFVSAVRRTAANHPEHLEGVIIGAIYVGMCIQKEMEAEDGK